VQLCVDQHTGQFNIPHACELIRCEIDPGIECPLPKGRQSMARNSEFASFHLTHWLCVVGLLAALAVGCTMVSAPTRVDDGITIHNVSVVDATGSSINPGMTVTIRKDRVDHVLPSHEMELGADIHIVDGTDRFLIPGLWDTHIPLQGTTGDVERVKLPVYLTHGITGIRLMAGCDPEYVAKRPDAKPCMSDTSTGRPGTKLA
jgi:hypothetical protein